MGMTYVNYGDYNFLDYGGCLVDSDHSDTEFRVLYLRPYDDEEDFYQCAELYVDIEDKWINKKSVMSFIGMTEENFDPIWYAIGCIDYYGPENFGADGSWGYQKDWENMTREEVKDALRHRCIATDNINIEW
jgi:hypothetical protein